MPKHKKKESKIEAIEFDPQARIDYLTGFHKRKLARIKAAQEAAALKAKEEHREFRKQLREERKGNVAEIEAALKKQRKELGETDSSSDEEEDGEDADGEGVEMVTIKPMEEEYVTESEGEEKLATVVIEPMQLSDESEEEEVDEEVIKKREAAKAAAEEKAKKNKDRNEKKKQKKKAHRYLTKGERRDDRRKQKNAKAKLREKYGKSDNKGSGRVKKR